MPAPEPGSRISELYEMDLENKRRLREIEQRLKGLDNSVKRVEEGMLDTKNKLAELAANIKSEKGVADSRIKTIENTISDIMNNMKRLAEKAEIVGLKELIDIYNPVKSQFVTRSEVESIIEGRIRK